MFAGSASGVALTELDGRVLRINAALAKTLNRTPAEIAAMSLFDLIHPEDIERLREGYRELVAGKITGCASAAGWSAGTARRCGPR